MATWLNAMELGYQRVKIQEESLHNEHLKHTGELLMDAVRVSSLVQITNAPLEVGRQYRRNM